MFIADEDIIARFTLPKQRITRPYEIILVDNGKVDNFSTHVRYLDQEHSYDRGHYDMTVEKAWADFTERVTRQFGYGPGTWEDYDLHLNMEKAS
jgi:hypothetical protein